MTSNSLDEFVFRPNVPNRLNRCGFLSFFFFFFFFLSLSLCVYSEWTRVCERKCLCVYFLWLWFIVDFGFFFLSCFHCRYWCCWAAAISRSFSWLLVNFIMFSSTDVGYCLCAMCMWTGKSSRLNILWQFLSSRNSNLKMMKIYCCTCCWFAVRSQMQLFACSSI